MDHQSLFSAQHRKLDETLSKRLDADKLVFSPKLNHLQMNALQSAQNSDSFRLQQLYQSIRNLEASLANKRRAIGAQHNCRFVSRFLGCRQSRATQLLAKPGTTVERRSVRELQSPNLSANTEHFINAIPKHMGFRPIPIEVLNISSSRIATSPSL